MWLGVVVMLCWCYLRVSFVSGALFFGACVFVKVSFDMLVVFRLLKSEIIVNWYVEDVNEVVYMGLFVTSRYGVEDGRVEVA